MTCPVSPPWWRRPARISGKSSSWSRSAAGAAAGPVSPAVHEDVCHFLYDASAYGFIVRTVEAPFFRRVVKARRAGGQAPGSALYQSLSARLIGLLGPGTGRPSAHTAPTRDGKGIVFVSHDGEVYPAGFLPLAPGQHPDPAAARDLPGRPAAEVDPGGEVHRAVRTLRVRRPVRRIAGPRLRRGR